MFKIGCIFCRIVKGEVVANRVFEDKRISSDTSFVIFAEVVSVGNCPAGHKVGDKFIFPTCMKKEYACPAAWYHAFPLMDEIIPECIDREAVRCPDWKSDVTMKIKED